MDHQRGMPLCAQELIKNGLKIVVADQRCHHTVGPSRRLVPFGDDGWPSRAARGGVHWSSDSEPPLCD